jgi:hypothetical protein
MAYDPQNKSRMQVFKNKGKDQDVSSNKLYASALFVRALFVGTSPVTCLRRIIAIENSPVCRMHSVFIQALFSFSC